MEQNKTNEAKTLTLKSKSGTFNRKTDGKEVAYTSYYVEIMGIEVKIEASDNTGKQLLQNYFKGA